MADLHDTPGGPEGVPADGAGFGVQAALLAIVGLAQVLQVLQLPELLPVESHRVRNLATLFNRG